MWGWITVGYAIAGLVSTILAFHCLPPEDGFRPSWMVRSTAAAILLILWPVLASLTIAYWIGHLYRCHIGEESVGRFGKPLVMRLNQRS